MKPETKRLQVTVSVDTMDKVNVLCEVSKRTLRGMVEWTIEDAYRRMVEKELKDNA